MRRSLAQSSDILLASMLGITTVVLQTWAYLIG